MTDQPQPRMEGKAFYALVPDAVAAIRALSGAARAHGLDEALLELVKLRASQLNGCAFCLQMHTTDARRIGLSEAKLTLLPVWHEAPVFTVRERAALAWTEALTLIAQGGVSDAAYATATAAFAPQELAYLTTAIGAINVWNRIAGAYHFTPQVPAEALVAA
ncbi:MAG: alkylhydroperoxidase [Bordetella sp. SCN 68-11]|nr:MAG: alkylhydroperoxidase [Bordetella sp. SCN 68-11]OJY70416.1 MAG: alkylhydroperoxidase [Rhodospirillales bacterium 70-18]